MKEIVYLLKVPEDEALQHELSDLLGCSYIPAYVRLSTLAPLSNYGYPPGSEGGLLSVTGNGVIVGVAENPDVPRSFVPWSNVAYLAESAGLENPQDEDGATPEPE